MTGKIYAYLGKNAASIDFPTSNDGANKGTLHVDFTGGNIIDRKSFALAKSKVITDPVLQMIIEKSPFFGKTVVIADVINYEDAEAEKKEKEYTEVTNFAEACQILKNEYGIKAQQLKSPAGARQLAKSLGIVFPNWK